MMAFHTDEYKNDRLMFSEKIKKRMRDDELQYGGELFHNIIFVYTESQQWGDVADLLRAQSSDVQCKPLLKTCKYLRQNLLYCFQNTVRLDLLDAIEQFEQRFFTYQQRKSDNLNAKIAEKSASE